ncbi:hypothetical protein P152DRAFT_334926 [Eremomyces bilateralis CBS 781.70]|uniref:Centromere protein H C-terminal domain-containing protein n=1 Tax=Eremomyces bilateralis CBS 781.70 TaxID=1392243 RepID=A0A6G1G4L9_9PEZI|nr:uncharacterized protein P152DRAFT_334926 [Eremomyces bilateralis CBS 781.70]KAF1813017.1 hypothetical protein P152DRAFT_334926 [Eremomyces bilateralis CBS 781.70]
MASGPTSLGEQAAQPNDISDLLTTLSFDAFQLSPREQQILDLWNQLHEIRLETAVLEAKKLRSSSHSHRSPQAVQINPIPAPNPDPSTLSDAEVLAALSTAETDLRATHHVTTAQQTLLSSILSTRPILDAVHSPSASDRLAPLIAERDVLALVSSRLATQLAETLTELDRVETRSRELVEENRGLVGEMVRLAEEGREPGVEEVVKELEGREDAWGGRLREGERRVAEERKRYRVMRGLVQGVVVGSGVNWAEDEKLVELVVEDEELG